MKKKDKIKKLEEELEWYRKNYKKVCSTVYEISEALIYYNFHVFKRGKKRTRKSRFSVIN